MILYEDNIFKVVRYQGTSSKGTDYDFVTIYVKDTKNDIEIPLTCKDRISSSLVTNFFVNMSK